MSSLTLNGGIMDGTNSKLNINSSNILLQQNYGINGGMTDISSNMFTITNSSISIKNTINYNLGLNNTWRGTNTFNADVSINNTNTVIKSTGLVNICGGVVNISGDAINLGGTTSVNKNLLLSGTDGVHYLQFPNGSKQYVASANYLTSNNTFTGTNTFNADVSINNTNTVIKSTGLVNICGGIVNISGDAINLAGTTSVNKNLLLSGTDGVHYLQFPNGSKQYVASANYTSLNNTFTGTNTFNADVSINNTNTVIKSTGLIGLSGGIVNISGDVINLAGKNGNLNINGLGTATTTRQLYINDSTGLITKGAAASSYSSITQVGSNIGIGNTNPQYALDVSGSVNTLNVTGTTNLNGGVKLNSNKLDMSDDGYRYIQNKSNGTLIGPMIVGYWGGSLGQSSVVASGLDFSPTLTWSGSNVGIGKTNPSYALDVSGQTYMSGPTANYGNSVSLQTSISVNCDRCLFSPDGLILVVHNGSSIAYIYKRTSIFVNFPTTSTTTLTMGTGSATISISSDGLTLIFGVYNTTTIYIFKRTSTSVDFPTNATTTLTWSAGTYFGLSSMISSDGLIIIVGANGNEYVYRRTSTAVDFTNSPTTTLTGSGNFGGGSAVSSDGLTIAVGSANSSFVNVYKRSSTSVDFVNTPTTTLTQGGQFGMYCAFSPDALTLFVGSFSGSSAYLYKRSSTSVDFVNTPTTTLTGSYRFGYTGAFSPDGLTLIVGTADVAALYIYRRSSTTENFPTTATTSITYVTGTHAAATNDMIALCATTTSVSLYKLDIIGGYALDVNGSARCSNGVWITSDKRIKNNIIDIDDGNALSILRKIQPKTYEYIDKKAKGNNTVIGFIAQEIQEIIPNACTISKDYIPNFYTKCQISQTDDSSIMLVTSPIDITWDDPNNVIDVSGQLIDVSGNTNTIANANPMLPPSLLVSVPLVDASGNTLLDASGNPLPNPFLINQSASTDYIPSYNIKIYDQDRNEIKCRTTTIVDKRSFLINVTGTIFETEHLQEEYFLYGQEVDNFHNLDKTAIYTVVTAAVQDMDRIQQAQAGEIQAQQEEVVSLHSEVSILKTQNEQLASQLSLLQSQVAALIAK